MTTEVVGGGTIDLEPAGEIYEENTTVTVTATEDNGWTFSGWSGAVSGTTNPETIIMDSDKTITATFIAPDMTIKQNYFEIKRDFTYHFSDTTVGTPVEAEFTIINTGTNDLNLTGTTLVDITGTNASEFTVTQQPTDTTLASGSSTTFTISFDPSDTTEKTAMVSIDNDTLDKNPYTFNLMGFKEWTNTHTITGTNDIYSVCFSSDGDLLFASFVNSVSVYEWDGTQWTNINTTDLPSGGFKYIALSSDESKVACGSGSSIRLYGWDGVSLTYIDHFYDFGGELNSIVFSTNDQIITNVNGKILILEWDGTVWTNTYLEGHVYTVNSVDVTLDGNRIVSGSDDDTIKIWDWDGSQWNDNYTLTGHTDDVGSVSISPDGNQVVSGAWDYIVKIWDWDGSQWNNDYTYVDTIDIWNVYSIDHSPDGQRIVFGSFNDDVDIYGWNGTDWINTHTLTGHTSDVEVVKFNFDGSKIASGSIDNTIKIWE